MIRARPVLPARTELWCPYRCGPFHLIGSIHPRHNLLQIYSYVGVEREILLDAWGIWEVAAEFGENMSEAYDRLRGFIIERMKMPFWPFQKPGTPA